LKLQLRHQPDHNITLRPGLVTIGSDPANGLVIRADGVSDFHAEFSTEGDRVFIVDLLSSAGTYVNEHKIGARQELQPWDVIRLGSAELELNHPAVAKPILWWLEISHPDGSSRRVDLTEVATIGRDPACEIALDSDLLSRRHAEIRTVRDYLEVTDLGSVNGTFINGHAVTRTLAYANDELTIDPYRLLIIGPDRRADVGDRTLIRSEPDAVEDVDQTELIEPDTVAAYLIEESSLLADGIVALKTPFSIGRIAGNDLVVDDRSVSKQHARIQQENGDWIIEDCGSSNGVRLNGTPVTKARLQFDDEIRLGRATFRLKSGQPDVV